jgi:hypothetical protein
MYCSSRLSWWDSAFPPFLAPGGGISQSSTWALNTNLIFEIGSRSAGDYGIKTNYSMLFFFLFVIFVSRFFCADQFFFC